MRVIRYDGVTRLAVTLMVAAGASAIVVTAVQSQSPAAQPQQAQAQQAQPTVTPPPASPSPPANKAADWPRVLKSAQEKAAPKPQSAWTEVEIQVAQARCLDVLKGLDIVAVGAPPVREHEECGTPAPIELISVGKDPEVTLSPTVTVTCDMAAALYKWVKQDLQPLAKKHLGAPIIRLDTMSSYSCRNAYGRTKSRLSEHGRANAIDIRSFTTARASTAEVLVDWGPTTRDIQAKIAAAKAEAARIEAAKAADAAAKASAVAKNSQQPATSAPAGSASTNAIASGSIRTAPQSGPAAALSGNGAPVPAPINPVPGLSIEPQTRGGIGLGITLPAPNRLGGPKGPATIAAENAIMVDTPASRMMFLKQAHEAGCRIFGTVLGPEANNAHRNHFHVDMAPRARGAFCE